MFVSETVWTAKNIQVKVVNIVQLATMFRGCALVWYMNLQRTTPTRQDKTLEEINQELLNEFKKPNLESQYIT